MAGVRRAATVRHPTIDVNERTSCRRRAFSRASCLPVPIPAFPIVVGAALRGGACHPRSSAVSSARRCGDRRRFDAADIDAHRGEHDAILISTRLGPRRFAGACAILRAARVRSAARDAARTALFQRALHPGRCPRVGAARRPAPPRREEEDLMSSTVATQEREKDMAAATRSTKKKSPRSRATAESMAAKQREISVSEFFAKNRHLLGFDNPRKAMLTTVKEAVDNALDACEEAGILPDDHGAHHSSSDETRFKITVRDNGPGIVRKQIENIFGKLLYGSKFHRMKMSRGQQGIGISAAGMYGLMTTGKPVLIISKTGKRKPAHEIRPEDGHLEEPRRGRQRRPSTPRTTHALPRRARHAGRDRTRGQVPQGAAVDRRVPRADGDRESARGVHVRHADERDDRRSRGRSTSCRRNRRRSSRIRRASSSAR